MKVRELIEELKLQNPEADVIVLLPEYNKGDNYIEWDCHGVHSDHPAKVELDFE